jgi:cellobiose phosphorylase
MFHLLAVPESTRGNVTYETDRMRFIGRGRTTAHPQALDHNATLSGSAGPVLDPVAAIRCRITLDPGETAIVDLISGIGETREACLGLVAKYQDRKNAERILAAAADYTQASLAKLGASEIDVPIYARLASSVIYANASLRADPTVLTKNHQGQSSLWAFGISGDLPLVLLWIVDAANIGLVRQLVRAHAYWRLHGLAVDLVILSENRDGRGPSPHEQITALIAACGESGRVDQPGGIFLRPADKVSEADRILLQAVARVVIRDADGSLAQQLERRCDMPTSIPPRSAIAPDAESPQELPDRDLLFDNGFGGFSPDGREYIITAAPGQMTPAPWVNVLANPSFGTLVSESGSATTWSENAQAFRLTPWSNDPVGDANTEAYYIRDEESGHVWSPTLLPSGGPAPYMTRHGFGYSVFEHSEDGIASELTVYVAIDAPIKFAVLTLRNASGRARRLSVTGYLEWVLGDERTKTGMHVNTEIDIGSGALFARNPYNTDFAGRTAFFAIDDAAP